MTDEEALKLLAVRTRTALSARKMDLYRQIQQIEALDEATPYQLAREGLKIVEVEIDDAVIRATEEQKDAYKIRREHGERRGYIQDIRALFELEGAES